MGTKYRLLYEGTAPGQAAAIECAGHPFRRGTVTEVPKGVYDLLKDKPGFKAGKAPSGADKE